MKRTPNKDARIIPISKPLFVANKKIKDLQDSLSQIDVLLNEELDGLSNVPNKAKTKTNNYMRKLSKFLFYWLTCTLFIFPLLLNGQQKTNAELKLDEVYASMGEGEMGLALRQIDTVIIIAGKENDLRYAGLGWNAKAEYYAMTTKQDSAIPYFKKALYYLKQGNSAGDIFRQYTGLGRCYTKIGQLDSALYYLEEADLYQNSFDKFDRSNYGAHNIYKARVYSEQGKIDEAIKYFHLTLETAHDSHTVKVVNSDLAFNYMRLHNLDKAEEHADLAFQYQNNVKGSALGFNRMVKAKIAIYKGEYEMAERYILEAIDSYKHSINKGKMIPYIKTVYASVKMKDEDIKGARKLLDEISVNDFDPKTERYAQYCLTKAEFGIKTGHLETVIDDLEKAENIAITLNELFMLRTISKTKADFFEKTRDQSQQILAMKQYQTLSDSLYNIQRLNIAQNIQAEYQTKQKEQLITQLELEDEMKATKLRSQRNIIVGSILGLCVLGALLFQLLRRNKKIKTQNELIAKALSDKDVLLREIHHRVKNNLQLVSSLLEMQVITTEDLQIKEAINAGKSRVMSMALIHQDLYNKENLTSVNVKEYLEKLSSELVSTYQLSSNQVRLVTDIEDIDIDVDALIPLGLIINELLTNSLKYAFSDKKEGVINIKFFEKNDLLYLEINDNGIGLSEEAASKNSFGFRMIKSLLRQLEGEMQTVNNDGTQIYFQFKDYKKAG